MHTFGDLDFSRASNAAGPLTIRIRTLRTLGSRQQLTTKKIQVWDRSLAMFMSCLCAADATKPSTRLAKRLFGWVVTLLDGRANSTRCPATSTKKPESLRRRFGFSGDW